MQGGLRQMLALGLRSVCQRTCVIHQFFASVTQLHCSTSDVGHHLGHAAGNQLEPGSKVTHAVNTKIVGFAR